MDNNTSAVISNKAAMIWYRDSFSLHNNIA